MVRCEKCQHTVNDGICINSACKPKSDMAAQAQLIKSLEESKDEQEE